MQFKVKPSFAKKVTIYLGLSVILSARLVLVSTTLKCIICNIPNVITCKAFFLNISKISFLRISAVLGWAVRSAFVTQKIRM